MAGRMSALFRRKRAAGSPTPPASPRAKLFAVRTQVQLQDGDGKGFEPVKDESGEVCDYRNVRIKGYLSTWRETTAADRDGDAVEKGAFTETIPMFMRNPVMLLNHRNSTENICGSFTVVREDDRGLYVEGTLSNAATDDLRRVRCLVAEGHLRTLSMGGMFYYREDGRSIFKVSLWEGSLVAIPANPDAIVSTRALTSDEEKRTEKGHRLCLAEFLAAT